jgi:nucleoside phosphorylase
MVGIGGGAPTEENDIRLGDVVVSVPNKMCSGVVQYDCGKRLPAGDFVQTGQLNAPPEVLLGAIRKIRRVHNDPVKADRIAEHTKRMDDYHPAYVRPVEDYLYRSDYHHVGGERTCNSCSKEMLISRPNRQQSARQISVHYGTIASGNSVIKDAQLRDRYARGTSVNVLCFEMEAAGLMNDIPCLIIRGICDYSDSHKNDDWHKYAALTAAAYAREVLLILRPRQVDAMPPWAEKINQSR